MAWILCAAPVFGAIRYVDPVSGDNGNSGASDVDAWATITYAATQVSSGDGIILMAGTHSGSITGPAGTMWYGAIGAPTAAILPGISLSTADNVSVKYVQVNGGISIGGSSSGDTLLNVTMRDTTATFSWNGDNNYASGLDVMAFRFVSEGSSPNNFDPPFDPAADNVMENSRIYTNTTSGGANAVNLRAVLRNTYRRVMFHTRYGGSMADAQGFGLYNVNNSQFYNCRFDLYNNKQGTQNNVKISIDIRDQVQHSTTEPSGFLVMQACTLIVGGAQYANDILFSNSGTKANSGRNRYDSLLVIDRAPSAGGRSMAYWQNHAEGDTVRYSVFVSDRRYPLWLAFKEDSTRFEHNTIVRLGSAAQSFCFFCDGYFANTDASNIARRNIVWSATNPSVLDGLLNWNATYGNQRQSESLYYSPNGNQNYAIRRTDGIVWSPSSYDTGTPDSKWGNPKFLMSNAVLQSSAALDSIVSWVFVQRKDPFALDQGSFAVNTPENGNDWTDGYVGARAPVSTASHLKFASTTGGGTDCSYASPCGLQFAMSIAAPGDTVRLLAGNYAGDSSVTPLSAGTTDDPIYIVAAGDVRVDSVIIKTSHVIVDSINATHGEILELNAASPVQWSKIRHGDYRQLWISGASNSTLLDCDVSGPVRVLGDWRSATARNGEAYRDTLLRLRITDTLSTSVPRLVDVRYARECVFDSLNVRGQLDATVDSVVARRIAYSEGLEWSDNRWRFSATGSGALAFTVEDSTTALTVARETWEADSTGTYSVDGYLTRGGSGTIARAFTYHDCQFVLTGANRLAGIHFETAIDSTVMHSRRSNGLLMSGEAWGLVLDYNTIRGRRAAIQSDATLWHGGTVLSNIFVADTLSDSSSAVVRYEKTALVPYVWNFNLYYAYRTNASTITDATQHAVAVGGLADSTVGVGGWTSRAQPRHQRVWGEDVTDGSSDWGDPVFSDTTFAASDWAPTTGSAAKRPDWPQGYSGAAVPEVDTTPPADVADLDALVNPGGTSVTLTWTQVGDDGSTGRAYIAYIAHEQRPVGLPSLLSSSTFGDYETPTQVANPVAPGATETVVMPVGSYYGSWSNYYMVKVCDGAGNCSYSNKAGPF